MARKYEEPAEDEAEDRRGMKATGMSKRAYEKSARDKREDEAGEHRIKVGPHTRRRPAPRAAAMPPEPSPAPSPFGLSQAPGEANIAPPPAGDFGTSA
jgi:hypothetical protein